MKFFIQIFFSLKVSLRIKGQTKKLLKMEKIAESERENWVDHKKLGQKILKSGATGASQGG